MSTPTFAKTHNLIAFLAKPSKSDGFEQIVDFLNVNPIKYALTVSPTIYTACIKQFWTTVKIKTINDDVRLQALVDGKKVIVTEASIRHDLKLNDAEGTSCLPNADIFEELARMGSTMASAIICLANNQKFNFSKYILVNLVKNLEAGVPFYMFPRFIQVFVNHQLGDMSHHKGIFVNPSLTKKVFANMKRVGTGFSGVVTPLFNTMMVQAPEEVGDLPTDAQDTPIYDEPSSSQPQKKHKPKRKQRKETEVSPTVTHIEENVPTPSHDPLPSGEDRMQLTELVELCTNLSNKILDLENEVIEMKSSHKAKIEELESKEEKLEEDNRSLTKEHKSFNIRVESPTIKETVVDKEESSEQGRKIADIDADAEVNLENVYNLDMAHEKTVLSMQDVDVQSEKIEDVVATAKNVEAKPKAKGVTIQDSSESRTTLPSQSLLPSQAKDKEVARRLEAEWNADMKDNIDWNEVVEQVQSRQSYVVRKYQALKRKHVSVAQARKNMIIYLKNMAGFKMDFFKGMSYEQIRPLFEEEYNKVQTLFKEDPEMDAERIKAPRKRTRKEKVEKDQPTKKQKGDDAKKQKLEVESENEEFKKNLEIVPNDEDDVFVNVTPLSSKPPTIVDYKIYKEGKKEYFQIFRANGEHQMYLAFSTMLKNFDREDLEVLWKIVKDRFKKSQPKEVLDVFLWHTLKVMFEHTVEDNVWKHQRGPQGLARVKNWKLFDSCRVHCVTLDTTQLFLLVEKMYPLTNCTLQQMFNEVRLQFDYEVEMAYDILRLGRIVGNKWILQVSTAAWTYNCQLKFILLLKNEEISLSSTMPPRRLRGDTSTKRSKRAAMEKHIADRVAKAIAEHEQNRPNPANAGGSRNVQGIANANSIPWNEFNTMMTTEYCPATEIQRMEQELWTLTLKGDDIEAYNNRFHELALMCPDLVLTEKKKIERYIKEFPERIKGNITSSKPTTLHDAINMARELVEQAVQGRAARIGENNKRKWEEHQRNTNNNNLNHHN
ncbi:putative ribonuclease H-like domain-containing protein [Tanacetum coccineum]|uniref:Ribonuclease H-like domain-containing protein n=1 Tax=Tanacetum coccineum TaxID=301880 RepID=A0ABQ5HI19_9ASTR